MNVPVIMSSQVNISGLEPTSYPPGMIFEPHYLDVANSITRTLESGYSYNTIELLRENKNQIRSSLAALMKKSINSNVHNSIDRPLVSVCIAHFNRFESLKTTLDSIISQTYDNVEIIVVDDGSDADELKKLSEYLGEFDGIELICQPNLYLGAARNAAAKVARGKYLLFKDDDNISKPHEVNDFVKCAEANDSEILVCFSGFSDTRENKGKIKLTTWLAPFEPIQYTGCSEMVLGLKLFHQKGCLGEVRGFTEHDR